MTELLTSAQMRAIEAAAIASGEVTGLDLMERAGRGVVEAVFEEWPELKAGSYRAVVLCGPGGNGGDGFVVARLLKEWGWEVEVFLYGDPERMPPDARVNYERWLGTGEVRDWVGFEAFRSQHKFSREVRRMRPEVTDSPKFDLLVDALFGTGLARPLTYGVLSNLGLAIEMALTTKGKSVCIDIPSGICADSGRSLGGIAPHFEGHRTNYPIESFDLCVTFHTMKPGHMLAKGAAVANKVRVVDIGLTAFSNSDTRHPKCKEVDSESVLGLWSLNSPWLPRFPELSKRGSILLAHKAGTGVHKFGFGHALVLSGASGRGGAARLAARASLRIGAGLVTIGCPTSALTENAARVDAIMLVEIDDVSSLSGYLLRKQVNAICLGPGLGHDRARDLVPVALTGAAFQISHVQNDPEKNSRQLPSAYPDRPNLDHNEFALARGVVLDADALSAYADEPDALFSMIHARCVLTPHGGEFARLFPDIAAKLEEPALRGPAYSKVDATREAAARAGCVVLFKGADTVIADPSGRCSINSAAYERAAPWLATAGSGDVLAGFITGLLARGFAPMQAAETAAWLHVECARSFGPGLIAEDLPEELPKVFRALGI